MKILQAGNLVIGGLMISYFNKYVNEWGIARTLKDTKKKNVCTGSS